ncbi:MAG: hypothetical protein DRP66_02640 [Planctomycetota bacterium]|nr:MAG: hypothetical protein DRP66_02640 [Planctomycetota bacterium]
MKNLTALAIFLVSTNCMFAETISRCFELRYVSSDVKADGVSDFKGPQTIFDDPQRLEYLKTYAEYAKRYFNDPGMDKKVVSLEQAIERLKTIKPQPLPSVRKRLLLNDWKAYGYTTGKKAATQNRIGYYNSLPGASVENGTLAVGPDERIVLKFKKQDWRMSLAWRVLIEPDSVFRFNIASAAIIDSENIKLPPGWTEIKVELDTANQRYNVYVNDKLEKDFVRFEKETREISSFEITTGSNLRIDDIWGVGFAKDYTDGTKALHSRDIPFLIDTFIDDDFEIAGDINGWTKADYDDSGWDTVDPPYAHGGERYKEEALYLRKIVVIPTSKRVELNAECLDPSGEIWINEKPVYIAHNRHPISLDITRYIDFGRENLIAVKVDPYKAKETMRHTSSDEYIGWFAGRMHLDCTSDVHVNDVFAITESIGELAEIKAEVLIKKEEAKNSSAREIKNLQAFEGQLQLKLYKWFPQESAKPVATAKQDIMIRNGKEAKVTVPLRVDTPELWSPEKCNLYKLTVEISDKQNKLIDDYVITTGIRTVGQEGGTFRINGKPAMMNGALLFSMPAPLEVLAKWQRCAPGEYIAKDLMQIKAMNGNTARMSQHHGPSMSINDPRYAEYGDQLGVIFQWATTSWVRTASPWQLDFEGLPKYVRQVRNHPSIVMWQPGNHPKFLNFEEGMEWFQKVYDAIRRVDKTRLICPTANLSRLGKLISDDGMRGRRGKVNETPQIWTAQKITRGSMEYISGYGKDWSRIRKWPDAKKSQSEQNWSMGNFRVDYLNSRHRAFFDFESEETAGQPNWDMRKGKPGYQVMSYEWGYDKGSIGDYLTTEQWLESQAWQALSGFEAYKKKRWLDYDGLAWCCLRGGGNTATYQKPLIDYYDHAKLGFYAVKMAFQPVLACSKNVDLAYGPSDAVPLVVMNLGDEKKVDLKIDVKTPSGEIVFSKTFPGIVLQEGRTFKNLELDIEKKLKPGYYAFEYNVSQN